MPLWSLSPGPQPDVPTGRCGQRIPRPRVLYSQHSSEPAPPSKPGAASHCQEDARAGEMAIPVGSGTEEDIRKMVTST